MGIIKDSFIFFGSFHEATKELPSDLYKEVITAFAEYALCGTEVEVSPVAKGFLKLAKPNIDNAAARYNASVENGKKGGNPAFEKGKSNPYYKNSGQFKDNLDITQDNPKITQTYPSDNPRDNLNVDVDEDIVSKKESKDILDKEHRAHTRESYVDVMKRLGFDDHTQSYIFKYIQWQQANGKIITNAMLEEMLEQVSDDAEGAITGITRYPRAPGIVDTPDYIKKEVIEYIMQSICQSLESQSFELKEPKKWLKGRREQ